MILKLEVEFIREVMEESSSDYEYVEYEEFGGTDKYVIRKHYIKRLSDNKVFRFDEYLSGSYFSEWYSDWSEEEEIEGVEVVKATKTVEYWAVV